MLLRHPVVVYHDVCTFLYTKYIWYDTLFAVDLQDMIIMSSSRYGVATISRLLKMIRLFCKRALQKWWYSAKETYDFIDPTDRSHPIVHHGMKYFCIKNTFGAIRWLPLVLKTWCTATRMCHFVAVVNYRKSASCDMTNLYVTWLIHMCHGSFMCDMTHVYVTWLILVWHDSSICKMAS